MPIERPSDRLYPCFFCLKGSSKDTAALCPNCGEPIDIGPILEGVHVEQYQLRKHVSRGYYGATFCAENRIGRLFAIKLVPSRLYERQDKSFEEEISKYHQLGSHQNIADLVDAGKIHLTVKTTAIEFFFIVMEWIDGITLTEYLKTPNHAANEVAGAILDVCSGLARFENKNLWHHDLNSDNILMKRLPEDERLTRRVDSPFIAKIVDTGSAVFRQARPVDRIGDLEFLGHHIKDLRKAALSHEQEITRGDAFFLHNLERIVARLLDETPARGFSSAATVSAEVETLYLQRFVLSEASDVKLSDPFAYLNANDFPNDAFINYLFSGKFPWVRDIVTPEAQSMLITGPRGSGKTMILRSMRLKTKLHPSKPSEEVKSIRDRIASDAQIAFFVSARIEIGNHCALTKLPRWAESEELIVYYFFLLYTTETLETIYYGLTKAIFVCDGAAEARLCKFLSNALKTEDAVTVPACLEKIKLKQYSLVRDGLSSVPDGVVLTSSFLSELAANLRELLPIFANKGVAFLLDDFSLPKIPAKIQQALLPLIWNTGGGYSFRVSAHSESVITEDLRRNHYKATRDYREINLGAQYLNSIDITRNEAAIKEYVNDIFSRRFRASAAYENVSFTDILGDDYAGNIAQEIRRRSERKTIRGLRYFGQSTLIKLCSGDISYLIDMLGQMLRHDRGSKTPVPHNRQHTLIKQYAWTELFRLHDFPADSCNLYEVALNFGKLSLFKLLQSDVTEGDSTRPAEHLRIEVEMGSESAKLRPVVAELLQSGIFVDGGFSNSSDGTPSRRLLFRKIFTPSFPTTYNSRDTFAWRSRRFLDFVRSPEKFVRAVMGEDGIKPDDQAPMLNMLVDRSS